MDPTKIRPQDVRIIVSEVSANPAGFVVSWRHFQMHWEQYLVNQKYKKAYYYFIFFEFQELFSSGSMSLGSIIEATTAHFSTEYDYRKVKAFFKSRRKFVGSGRRALDQVR